MLELTDKNFNKTINGGKPVLVDFWAPWCAPCVSMTPQLEKAAEELGDAVIVGKMNVDENEKVFEELNLESIPTLMLYIDGKCVDTHIGAIPKSKIVAFVKRHL